MPTTRDAILVIRVTNLRNETDYENVVSTMRNRISTFNSGSAVVKMSLEQARMDRTDSGDV